MRLRVGGEIGHLEELLEIRVASERAQLAAGDRQDELVPAVPSTSPRSSRAGAGRNGQAVNDDLPQGEHRISRQHARRQLVGLDEENRAVGRGRKAGQVPAVIVAVVAARAVVRSYGTGLSADARPRKISRRTGIYRPPVS